MLSSQEYTQQSVVIAPRCLALPSHHQSESAHQSQVLGERSKLKVHLTNCMWATEPKKWLCRLRKPLLQPTPQVEMELSSTVNHENPPWNLDSPPTHPPALPSSKRLVRLQSTYQVRLPPRAPT